MNASQVPSEGTLRRDVRRFAQQHRVRCLAVCALTVLFLLIGASTASAVVIPARIAGTVTNGSIPVAGIRVYPYYGSGSAWVPVGGLNWAVTDASGAYALPYTLSPAGLYRVGFEDPAGEYLNQFYSGASTVESGVSVYVGGTTATVNATLSPSGINGTVRYGATPMAGYVVQAFLGDGLGGWNFARSLRAGAGGTYHFGGLTPGDYKVLFPDYDLSTYRAQYFSGATLASATVVSISATTAANGVDAALVPIAADIYEPDGSTGTSHLINVNGAPELHTIYPYGEYDFVRFDALSGHHYAIATRSASGWVGETGTYVSVYDPTFALAMVNVQSEGNYSYLIYTPALSGEQYVRVEGWGAVPLGAYLLEVTSDLTPPVVTDDAPDGWATNDVTVTISATDAESGVASIRWRRTAPGGAVSSGTTSAASAVLPVAAEGTTTVAYSAIDVDGNRSATSTVVVRIDKTPPGTTAPSTASYVGTVTVPLTAADSISGVAWTRWSLDAGSNWTTGSVATVTGLGSHTVTYQSADVAGNTEVPKSVTFSIVDVQATSITIKTTATSARTGSVPILSGVVTPTTMIGKNIVAYVKKPGKTYWTYSSNRTVYNLGGKAAWQYKYYFKPGMVKGYYVFKAVVPAWPGFLTSTSPTTVSIRLQ